MSLPELRAFHLATPDGGFRFCVERRPPPDEVCRGDIVHVPAFGEEMNKSRHMVALQAERLAVEGWRVLQIDPLGTGDSSGDFADATWDAWLADVRLAVEWVQRDPSGPLWLWGLRLGCLLAAEAMRESELRCGLLMWQPVTSGKQHLQQFLRMWKMAQVVGKAADHSLSPQHRLDAGQHAEVAGYSISPRLAAGMQGARLRPLALVERVHWCQVASADLLAPTPAFETLRSAWADAGIPVTFAGIEGTPFWQTQEISVVSSLLERTSKLLSSDTGGRV